MRNRRRGFTLVELGVVCIIIVTMTAVIIPNMLAIQRSRNVWQFEQAIQRLVASSIEEAINRNREMVLTFDDGKNQFLLSTEAASQDSSGAPIGSGSPTSLNGAADDQERKVVASVILPSGTTVQQYQKAGQASNSGEWQIHFFPDGTCEGGGIELSENGATRTLYIDPRGSYTFSEKALPDPSTQEWTAGDFQRRA